MKIFHIFDQNHRLTPLKKDIFKSSFLSTISENYILDFISQKRKLKIFYIFDQNHRVTPLKKSELFFIHNIKKQSFLT